MEKGIEYWVSSEKLICKKVSIELVSSYLKKMYSVVT